MRAGVGPERRGGRPGRVTRVARCDHAVLGTIYMSKRTPSKRGPSCSPLWARGLPRRSLEPPGGSPPPAGRRGPLQPRSTHSSQCPRRHTRATPATQAYGHPHRPRSNFSAHTYATQPHHDLSLPCTRPTFISPMSPAVLRGAKRRPPTPYRLPCLALRACNPGQPLQHGRRRQDLWWVQLRGVLQAGVVPSASRHEPRTTRRSG